METMENSDDHFVNVPSPSVGGSYSHGWETLKKYFLELLLVAFVLALIQTPQGWMNFDYNNWDDSSDFREFWSFSDRIYGIAYWVLIATPIEYGIALVFLRAVRGEKIQFKEIISGFNRIVDVILSRILVFGIVGIGFFLFIIPGIIFMIRLTFVPLLVMDKGMDAISAVKESWRLTSHYGWTIFGMALLAIPIFFGGVLVLIIGAIVSIIWIYASFASLYYAVTGKPTTEVETE